MVQQHNLTLAKKKKGFHLVTAEIEAALGPLPQAGIAQLFLHHTSAGICINENADPTVRGDLDRAFDVLAPEDQPFYQHTMEGPDDMPAHVKSVIVGCSLSIPITNGKLALATWQGIFLCEFRDHASPRRLTLTVIH